MVVLDRFVEAFASALQVADARRPQWISATTGKAYMPGIGPHTETQTVALVVAEIEDSSHPIVSNLRVAVPYPSIARQKCDLVVDLDGEEWALEIKMLRFMGDNGKPNDNILMHILSPYPAHRSALTDTTKLIESGFGGHKAVVIYGYDYDGWPMEPAIEAFEALAATRVELGQRHMTEFSGLVHPIHQQGRVFAWEVFERPT